MAFRRTWKILWKTTGFFKCISPFFDFSVTSSISLFYYRVQCKLGTCFSARFFSFKILLKSKHYQNNSSTEYLLSRRWGVHFFWRQTHGEQLFSSEYFSVQSNKTDCSVACPIQTLPRHLFSCTRCWGIPCSLLSPARFLVLTLLMNI